MSSQQEPMDLDGDDLQIDWEVFDFHKAFETKDVPVPVYKVDVSGELTSGKISLGRGRGRGKRVASYSNDVFKSLDDIVEERAILNPPHYRTRFEDPIEDLPITGTKKKVVTLETQHQEKPPKDTVLGEKIKPVPVPLPYTLDDLIGIADVNQNANVKKSSVAATGETSGQVRIPKRVTFQGMGAFKKIEAAKASVDKFFESPANKGEEVDPLKVGLDEWIQSNKEKKKEMNPLEASLDDIIRSKKTTGEKVKDGTTRTKRKRDRRAFEELFEPIQEHSEKYKLKHPKEAEGEGIRHTIPTPHAAVAFLSEAGLIIEIKFGKLEEGNEDVAHLWRCEITCGEIKVLVESERKVIAREIACNVLLGKLKEVYPTAKFPKYEIPKELFIDPKIFKKLEEVARENATVIWDEFGIEEDPLNKGCRLYKYSWCFDDGKEAVGRSHDLKFSKLLAAHHAYLMFEDEPFPKTTYFVDEQCKNYEYTFIDSEFYIQMEKDENFKKTKQTSATKEDKE